MNILIKINFAIVMTVWLFVVYSALQVGMGRMEFYFYLTVCGVVFMFFSFLTYLIFKDKARVEAEHKISNFCSLGLTLFLLCTIYFSVGGFNGILRDWIAIHSEKTTLQVVLFNVSANAYLFLVALICYEMRDGFSIKRATILLLITLAMLVVTRTKANLLPPILGLIFTFVNSNHISASRKVFGLFFLILAGYALYIFTTLVRWLGGLGDLNAERVSDKWKIVKETAVERNMGYQSTQIFNRYMDSSDFEFKSVINILDPLMRLIIDEQVGNPMYIYSESLYGVSGQLRGSVHPSIFIDGYANFGAFGVFQAVIIFVLVVISSKVLASRFKLLGLYYSIVGFGYALTLAARGSVYYGMLYVLVGFAFIITLHLCLSILGLIRK